MRQQKDSTFSDILNRARIGNHTVEDVKVLHKQLVSSGSVDLLVSPFDTASRLYPCSVDIEGHKETQIICLAKDNELFRIDVKHAIL